MINHIVVEEIAVYCNANNCIVTPLVCVLGTMLGSFVLAFACCWQSTCMFVKVPLDLSVTQDLSSNCKKLWFAV